MILQVILACVLCFVITAVAGKLLIPELIKLKAAKSLNVKGFLTFRLANFIQFTSV